MEAFKLAGLVGSVRKQSYNAALMETVRELLPDDFTLDVIPIDTLPFYNEDLEGERVPESVQRFRKRLQPTDGLVIATPEYNFSFPGILKNAIDWASRPLGAAAIYGKPVALMGASAGNFGTVRAQLALRQVLIITNNPVVNRPEIVVPRAQEKFDADGRLTDPLTLTLLSQSLDAFVAYMRSSRPAALVTNER